MTKAAYLVGASGIITEKQNVVYIFLSNVFAGCYNLSMDKKVLIINTGGTIGMIRTANGYAPKKGALLAELEHIRDLSSPDIPSWDILEFDPLLDSTNVKYEQWNQIAHAIKDNYPAYDGFVVLHGTDTLAYSASALSFMLENLNKPVIFTGSQIPLCEIRSDGRDNLITSIIIAADGIANGVSLYFGNYLYRGNRTTKYSADGMEAFASPNFPPLAKVGIDIEYGHAIDDKSEAPASAELELTEMKECKLGVIKVFPGMQFDLFKPIVREDLDGLILETFGAGNIPTYDKALISLIQEAKEMNITVVVCTQCPQGSVRLGAYEAGSALVEAGAVSGYNMTTEAAVTKLSFLLSRGCSFGAVRNLMEMNLRGELSK